MVTQRAGRIAAFARMPRAQRLTRILLPSSVLRLRAASTRQVLRSALFSLRAAAISC